MRLSEIVGVLQQKGFRVRQYGERYRAQCPGHGGDDLNLQLYEEPGGKVKAWCWSHDCSAEEIAEGLGLRVADFVPPRQEMNGGRPEPEAVYPYRDEEGNSLFEVVRMPGHDFWQRLPGASRGGIGTARRVLFGLPELLKTGPGDVVCIVEGEKDAINVACLGIAATTNPHGARHWRQEHTDWLKEHLPDRRFVILPDNDEKGYQHAEEVYRSLQRAGLDAVVVKLPDLPPKGDVSDWIKTGGTGEKLRLLAAPPRHPLFEGILTGSELQRTELLIPEALVPNLLFRGFSTLLAGDSKLGKSSLVLRMLLSMATGGWWLDRQCLQENRLPTSRVLFLNFEDPLFVTRERALRMMAPEGLPDNLLTRPVPYGVPFAEILRWLPEAKRELGLDAVILDPISVAAEWKDETDNSELTMTFKALQRVASETGLGICSIHHVTKKPGQRGLNIRGAGAIKANVLGYLVLEEEKERLRLHGINKLTGLWDVYLGRNERDYSWWIEETTSGSTRTAQQRAKEQAKADLLDVVHGAPGLEAERLADIEELPVRTCREYLSELEGEGLIFSKELPRGEGQRGPTMRGWFAWFEGGSE